MALFLCAVQYILVACLIHSSLYLLTPYPYLTTPCFPLCTGNHWFVLCIFKSVSVLLYPCNSFIF